MTPKQESEAISFAEGYASKHRIRPDSLPDIEQAALIGMWYASSRYNESKKVPFLPYARQKMTWQIVDWIRSNNFGLDTRREKRQAIFEPNDKSWNKWRDDRVLRWRPLKYEERDMASNNTDAIDAKIFLDERDELFHGRYLTVWKMLRRGLRIYEIAKELKISFAWARALVIRVMDAALVGKSLKARRKCGLELESANV